MQEDNNINYHADDEQEIDLLELAQKLWASRKLIFKWAGIGVIVGLVVAFSIPREYTTTVKLAPELNGDSKSNSGMSSLAALAGINLQSGGGMDAVYPNLYPDVVSSVPFSIELFNVKVADKEGNTFTVKDYLTEETKAPWWGAVMSLPGKVIGGIMSIFRDKEEDEAHEGAPNPFKLTSEENSVVQALGQCIVVDVDTKTSVITLSATMQDPVVSAMLVDTVATRLRQYVTNYRTEKARQDLKYAEKINKEARDDYYKAQQRFADYSDRNQGVVLRSAQIERDRLQNEASLAFNLYNQTSQQLQMAQAKVQQTTPVFTVVQPATVPLKPSKPSKAMVLVGFVFLAVVGSSAWILFGRDAIAKFQAIKHGKQDETEPQE
jgi:hypothetical protein